MDGGEEVEGRPGGLVRGAEELAGFRFDDLDWGRVSEVLILEYSTPWRLRWYNVETSRSGELLANFGLLGHWYKGLLSKFAKTWLKYRMQMQ